MGTRLWLPAVTLPLPCLRGNGAFGQYAIVMPDQDAVIAITSETACMQGELNLIWSVLLAEMKHGTLQANRRADAALQQKLASVSLPVKSDQVTPSLFAKIAGKKLVMDANAKHIQSMTMDYKNNI